MNRMAILRVASLAIITGLVACTANAANEAAVGQATNAATQWLKLVDDGNYRASYDQASSLFKNALNAEQWVQKIGAARKPLGAVESRKVKLAEYATSLPGAPDGQYVVIQFDTSFANKKSAFEIITPMMKKDGQWRVSGYYIK